MNQSPRITTNLWFAGNAQEAVDFYMSVFPNSRMLQTSYYGKEGEEIHKMPAGSVLTIEFEIDGYRCLALNGGPIFQFTEAISLIVNCANQQEIDYYWEKLTAGGDEQAQQCGWLKDRFGLSWQVVPTMLAKMITDGNNERSERVMRALMQMKKLDLAELEAAYNG